MGLIKQLATLGSKVHKKVATIGSKVEHALNNIGSKATRFVQNVSKSTGLDKVAKTVGDTLEELATLGNGILNMVDEPARSIIKRVYKFSPVGRVLETASVVADIVAGKKPITDDLISSVFPAYEDAKNQLNDIKDLAKRKFAKDALKEEATKLIVGMAVSKLTGT